MPSRPQRLVTIDLGNTSASLRAWEDAGLRPGTPVARARVRSDLALPEVAVGWLEAVAPGADVALSSVAGRALTDEVVGALQRAGSTVLAPPDPGLQLAIDSPETVGEDRLFAARGAAEAAGGRCIVVDAGTALTVDAVGWTPEGAVFLGGAIAPGPELLADALAGGTGRLPRVAPRPGAEALGRDTPGALRAGISAALRGAARELLRGLLEGPALAAYGAPSEAVPVFLVGGAAPYLLEPEPVHPALRTDLPDLVHRGLWHAWRHRA